MSFFFGDGFDLYSAPADAINGYWDSGTVGFSLVAGRFSGSRALQNFNNTAWLVKSSGSNDAVHHIVCAFQQTQALSGTTLGAYFQLTDGTTNQCCIVFRSDGAILLTSATPAGTVLATYTGAVTAASTWYAFEIEVFISNTAGYMNVRKNGNPSNDFASATNLNTRPGTNSYANKLTVGQQATVTNHLVDDLLWRSDASSVPWVGDVRCFTRMPVSDASVAWTPSTPAVPVTPFTGSTAFAATTSQAVYTPFTPFVTGSIGSVSFPAASGNTGNTKCTIFSNSGGNTPGAILGSATPLSNTVPGILTFTFPAPVPITAGTAYWVGMMTDTASGFWTGTASGTAGATASGLTYAVFPTANPSVGAGRALIITAYVTPTGVSGTNYGFVNEPQQDAASSYVYSSTVGQSDLYGIAAIASTPTTIVGVTTRGFLQKSDAGTRNCTVDLKSGSTTVHSASVALNTTWGWVSRTDTTDPNTGAAWTATGVNNAQIGVTVSA